MSLTPLFEIDDIYRRMFDKMQLQYNNQGYAGSFCLFDVWGDIETDLDINKANYEGTANLRIWYDSCEIEKEQPERGMTTRIDLPRDRSAYRCDADLCSVYIEFPKYVQRFKLQDDYDYTMLIIALNKCLDSENPREKIEKGFSDINPDLLNTSITTSLTIASRITVESYTKHGRFEDRNAWTKTQLTLKDQSISIWATHQDGFVMSSIEKDTVIKVDKDGWSKAFVDKGITGFEIWKFTSLDDFAAFLNFVSQLWPVNHNKVKATVVTQSQNTPVKVSPVARPASPLLSLPDRYSSNYRTLADRLNRSPRDISNVGHMVSLLQDYVFSANLYEWSGRFSDNWIFSTKQDAARKTIEVISGIKDERYLHMDYLAIMAQNHLIVGDWKAAMKCYEQMLAEPGVLNVQITPGLYAGELELAAKLIHNISTLYYCALHIRESVEYKRKYQHVFDYEYQRYQRLMRNNPSLSDGFTEEWDRLNGRDKKCIFCDFTLKWGYGITGDGMLSAIQKDCVRNREPHRVKLDEHIMVFGPDYGVVTLFDDFLDEGLTEDNVVMRLKLDS